MSAALLLLLLLLLPCLLGAGGAHALCPPRPRFCDEPLSFSDAALGRLSTAADKLSTLAEPFAPASRFLAQRTSLRGLAQLLRSDVPQRKHRSCVVIGGSGSLLSLNATARAAILLRDDAAAAADGSDSDGGVSRTAVFRVNNHPVAGLERFVGGRTTYRVSAVEFCGVMVPMAWEYAHNTCLRLSGGPAHLWPFQQYVAGIPSYRSGSNHWRQTRFSAPSAALLQLAAALTNASESNSVATDEATAAFVSVLLAVRLCERVEVFGMDNGPARQAERYSPRYHYWEEGPPTFPDHMTQREKEVVRALHQLRRITYWDCLPACSV